MLSDKLPSVKSPPRNTGETRKWYSDNQKIEAVKLWLVTGNMPVTAASLNIPLPTLKQWRYSKWWDEISQEIRTEGALRLSNRLRTIAEKALDVTLDRLENGDFILDQKEGKVKRKPVSMRDAYQVTAGLLDRHMELDKKPQEQEQQQKVQDRLEALAQAFEKFAGKQPKPEIIDVEPKEIDDALHEEREEGLRQGTPVGAQEEALSSEGSGEEGSGSEGDGEDLGEYAEFDACGPQETLEIGRFKLSKQSSMDQCQEESQ